MLFLCCAILFLEFSVAANCPSEDTPSFIVRPCPELELNCIRRFFGQYGECQPVCEPGSDVYDTGALKMPIPSANTTYLWENAQISGLNEGCVSEFCINTQTKKLVFQVNFDKFNEYCPWATARYHFPGREPIDLSDWSNGTYKDISMTLTAPFDFVNGVGWSQKDVYLYFKVPELDADIGDGLITSSDPEVQEKAGTWLGNLIFSVIECSPIWGTLYFGLYFENNICDLNYNYFKITEPTYM